MLNTRFRGIRALYGQEAFEKLQRAKVLVIGVGGVGSWLAESLCRSAVGHLVLIDPDTVEEGNSNRQSHTLKSNYGKNKAQALKERFLDINEDLKIEVYNSLITQDNVNEILDPIAPDFVCEAIDDLFAKAAINNYLYQHKIPFVTSGGAGGRIDPSKLKLDDISKAKGDALISQLRQVLRKRYNFPKAPHKMGIICSYSNETPKYTDPLLVEQEDLPKFGAAMVVTASAGLLIASHIIKKIINQ